VSVATVILWARDVVSSSGVGYPATLLRPPDGRSSDPSGGFVTLKRCEGGLYHGLLALLDASRSAQISPGPHHGQGADDLPTRQGGLPARTLPAAGELRSATAHALYFGTCSSL